MPRDNRCMYMVHVCFYVCCSDCVGVCGNVCCVAAVVKDSSFRDQLSVIIIAIIFKNVLTIFLFHSAMVTRSTSDL